MRTDISSSNDLDFISDDEEDDEDVIVPARLMNEAIKVKCVF